MVISSDSRDRSLNQNLAYQLGRAGLTGRGNRSDRLDLGQPFWAHNIEITLSLTLTNSVHSSPCQLPPSLSRAPSSPNSHSQIPHPKSISRLGELQIRVKDHPLHVLLPGVTWNLQFSWRRGPFQGKQARVGSISFSR